MGGQAFNKPGPKGEPPIFAERLSPEMYRRLKKEYAAILSIYYERVICPTEAPGKADHGDIDFLVDTPLKYFTISEIVQSLDAQRFVDRGDGYSFAILFPSTTLTAAYAQLDIHPCSGNLDWLAFMQSYGDLWQILGVAIRPYGLTATDKGLHVRVAEMETKSRKSSMLFMSKEPVQVLRFLGLNTNTYEHGFGTEDQLFRWISTCRFIDKETFLSREDTKDDRRRLLTRGMFKRFMEDLVPSLPTRDQSDVLQDREATEEEAALFFGKTEQYKAKISQARTEIDEETVWALISSLLGSIGMSKDSLNLVLRALKRWIEFKNEFPIIREMPEMEAENQPCFAVMLNDDKDGIRADMAEWMMQNWDVVKAREKRRIKAKKEDGVLERTGYT